jgi:hypothetical protein
MSILLRFLFLFVATFASRVGVAEPSRVVHARVLVEDTSAAARRAIADTPGARLFRAQNDRKGAGWLIDGEALTVSRVIQTKGRLDVVRTWDFGALKLDDAEARSSRSLHPVLYPLGNGRFAMALLTRESTGYAGGGASWIWASFYELRDFSAPDEVVDGRLELLYAAVPFSCNKAIRACFTEEEYRSAKRCQETWDGVLRLRYTRTDSTGALTLVAEWEERHAPGGMTKEKPDVTRTTISLSSPPTSQCTEPI